VRRKDDDDILANLAEEIVESIALSGLKTCRRLIDNDQSRIPMRAWAMPKRWCIPPE
jgi:hypothetical protein